MFPFVPRRVAQAGKSTSATASTSQPRRNAAPTNSVAEGTATGLGEGQRIDIKGKRKAVDAAAAGEDYYPLVCLALSDRAIWADPHLRSRLVNGSDGYIPLQYLLSHSPVLSALDPPATETLIAKAIRAQQDDLLDVRVLVSAPSRAEWYGKDGGKDQPGGYEVRRQDWADVLQRSQHLTEDHWSARSIYVENIPPQRRTIAGIACIIHSLTTSPTTSNSLMQAVQHIWLPPHVQDRPGDRPKCKGFALITLSSTEQAEKLVRQWPWNVRRTDLHNMADTAEAREAVKFGFRVMPRERWEQLRDEYIAYRQTLLDTLAYTVQDPDETMEVIATEEDATLPETAPDLPTTDLWSPYPQGCLIFVRNVHPETNKTTLRALFSQAFAGSDAPDEGVDYVDFSKGMDTCYLRLTSARHTRLLTESFAVDPKAQSGGLDATGITPSPGTNIKAIALEVVEGTREELYWHKVPEKVRRQAVEKAAATVQPEDGGKGRTVADDPAEGKRKRKRRKRGE